MPGRLILILVVLVLLIASCSSEPETVIVTVVHEATVEVEVTRVVEYMVKVPQDVEVTRVVEVPIEVTRIVEIEVERVIVPTPIPTLFPTATRVPAPVAAPAQSAPEPDEDLAVPLLKQLMITHDHMIDYGGQLDKTVRGRDHNCVTSNNLHEAIVSAPEFDVSTATPEVQSAYTMYRTSIAMFVAGTKELSENCQGAVLVGDGTKVVIPTNQGGPTRQRVADALEALRPAIRLLEGE